MGSVNLRLDKALVFDAQVTGVKAGRSAARQIEHWAKIGHIMEGNPDLTYEFVRDAMISKAQAEEGLLEEYRFG